MLWPSRTGYSSSKAESSSDHTCHRLPQPAVTMQPLIAVPVTLALVAYAHLKKKLTPSGIAAAVFTAAVHAYHPWNLPFVLLVVFFLIGTRVTKIKQDYKATLTLTSSGANNEGPRTHIQVFANSLIGTSLTWMHAHQLRRRERLFADTETKNPNSTLCFSWGPQVDLLVIGIVANYAVAAADTFSSELGILARSEPRLITDPARKVPRGTNGGVTLEGLAAGLLGSIIMSTTAIFFLPTCDDSTAGTVGGGVPWTAQQRAVFLVLIALWGLVGSIFDSWLGASFQRTVKDVRSGKVVEGEGGNRAMVSTDEGVKTKHSVVKDVTLKGEGPASVEKPEADAASSSAIDDTPSDVTSRAKYDPKDKHRTSSFGDSQPTRVVENGVDILDNNDVNFSMTFCMSLCAMALAGQYFGVPFNSISTV
ncbi:Transmembrane protein 19 like [Verticillium longisporum]|nr:Transmembrane protein 19 like [Verticillium longisporum]